MRVRKPDLFVLALSLSAAAALLAACGGSSSAKRRNPGPSTDRPPLFFGVGSADPVSPHLVVVSWPPARNVTGPPEISSMIYKVYRALDVAAVLEEAALVFTTGAGETTYSDPGMPAFTTLYYRVEAVNPEGLQTSTRIVTSARTPSEWMPGSIDYTRDVAPLWSTTSLSGQSCLTCHDGSSAGGRLDLSSWEGVAVGVGSNPETDSFLVPFDGDATWSEFLLRFSLNPVEHLQFNGRPQDIAAMQAPITMWAEEGGLEQPDGMPPAFAFGDINNAGRYHGEFTGPGQVRITFFHASDAESVPLNGDTTGQIEYQIYGGADAAAIDWLNPVAVTFSNDARSNPTMSVEFSWDADHGVFVVRALDAAGRLVQLPAPEAPDYLEQLALLRRNMSAAERELEVHH